MSTNPLAPPLGSIYGSIFFGTITSTAFYGIACMQTFFYYVQSAPSAPAAAVVLMGKGGMIAILLAVFMAVTSAASSELIGVSSLFSYKPNAMGEEIVRVSHYFICFWAVWMGCWASILNAGNINLGWLYYVQGVVLSPAVIPITLTISWSKLTRAGIFCGAIGGGILGMLAWMVACLKIYGQINITNLADPYSAVCSGLTGLLFSGILTVSVSLMSPADYDFSGTRAIAILDNPAKDHMHQGSENSSRERESHPDLEKQPKGFSSVPSALAKDEEQRITSLRRVFKKAFIYSTIFAAIVIIIVPLPMFFSHYVFSRKFYTFWTTCTM
ncbi:hypothetical protein L210DRAFT_3651726 [Boletus edulis BED1]|uniref:Urea transporter n=1 Tax=Boletus edulis BED1 TaxID=1328754 RepID=A0AAD4BI03_BOLED|nr:hypothetical protein L210DRAFT_3651726 [Boletus edulis BED1]